MKQAPKKVNAYVATKTTLTNVRGLGVRTLEYIWNCRTRGVRIDIEKLRHINPKVMHMLDFTVPRNYDSDSSSHGSSETKTGGQLENRSEVTKENQTEVDNGANNAEDEEATDHDIPEERVVTDDGNVPEPELEFEEGVHEPDSPQAVANESSESHVPDKIMEVSERLERVISEIPQMIRDNIKHYDVAAIVRHELMNQNVSAAVSAQDTKNLADQMSRLSIQLSEVGRQQESDIKVLQDAIDSTDNHHQNQYDECRASLGSFQSRVQALETHTSDFSERLHTIETSLTQETNDDAMFRASIGGSIHALREQMQQFDAALGEVQHDLQCMWNKTTVIVNRNDQPCTSTPRDTAPTLHTTVNTDVVRSREGSSTMQQPTSICGTTYQVASNIPTYESRAARGNTTRSVRLSHGKSSHSKTTQASHAQRHTNRPSVPS